MIRPQMFCLLYPTLRMELLQKGLKYFKVLMVRICCCVIQYLVVEHTYSCTNAQPLIMQLKSQHSQNCCRCCQKEQWGWILQKKYRQLQNTSHFKRNLLPHSSFSYVHIIFFEHLHEETSMAIANLWIMKLPRIEKSNLVN